MTGENWFILVKPASLTDPQPSSPPFFPSCFYPYKLEILVDGSTARRSPWFPALPPEVPASRYKAYYPLGSSWHRLPVVLRIDKSLKRFQLEPSFIYSIRKCVYKPIRSYKRLVIFISSQYCTLTLFILFCYNKFRLRFNPLDVGQFLPVQFYSKLFKSLFLICFSVDYIYLYAILLFCIKSFE